MTFCFNIIWVYFFNNQFQCLTLANIHFNTCIIPQFNTNSGIFLLPLIVDLLFFSTIIHVSWFQGRPYHLMIQWWFEKRCSLIHVATRLACLELHKVVFRVSRILLIVSFQRLLNFLLINHWVNLWNFFLEWVFSHLRPLKKIHGTCKHCPVVVFHIRFWNVYSLFQYYNIFFIYLCIRPLLSHPFIHFVYCFFPLFSPCSDF